MKQMILCKKCREWWANRINKYPDEHIKIVDGIARDNFRCDGCVPAVKIAKGEACSAVSNWTDTMRIQYYEWEHGYIKPDLRLNLAKLYDQLTEPQQEKFVKIFGTVADTQENMLQTAIDLCIRTIRMDERRGADG